MKLASISGKPSFSRRASSKYASRFSQARSLQQRKHTLTLDNWWVKTTIVTGIGRSLVVANVFTIYTHDRFTAIIWANLLAGTPS